MISVIVLLLVMIGLLALIGYLVYRLSDDWEEERYYFETKERHDQEWD